MTKEQQRVIRVTFLGTKVLHEIMRAAGLDFGAQRADELLQEMRNAFSFLKDAENKNG